MLTGRTTWPYEAIGVGFAAVGIGFITQAFVRQRRVDAALDRGEYAPLPERTALPSATVGVLLGLATIGLVLAGQT